MPKLRVYVDLESLKGLDYKSVAIYECKSPDEDGVLIDTVTLKAGHDFVEFNNASDVFSWFKLAILDGYDSEIISAEKPILAEFAWDKVAYIRRDIKDTNVNDPAFSDKELIEKMRLAALRFSKLRNLSEVQENIWPIISLLVRIDTCYVLAYDYAKYMRLEVPGGAALSKDELYRHYLDVVQQLESYYDKIKAELTKNGTETADGDVDITAIHTSNMELDRSGI